MERPPIESLDDTAARDARAAEVLPPTTSAQADLQDAVQRLGRGGVFHGYQREMIRLSHVHELLLVEKSRRIGATWAFAGDDAVTAATNRGEGGDDILYISYSHDMAREYIEACAAFAKAFMNVDAVVGEFMFQDEDPGRPGETRGIMAYRIDFASGFSIQALSSRPRSLRGKQGKVRIDEAAFVDDLDELIKAAMALVMLGGSVAVLSTHNGMNSAFNRLIQAVRAGDQAGCVYRVTFQDAIDDGLYDRVAIKKGEISTPEGRAAYVAKIRKLYGAHAAEELDAIPSRGSGAWLAYDQIERAENGEIPVLRLALEDSFAHQPDHLRLAFIQDWCAGQLLPILQALNALAAFGVGGDFARSSDLSVLWPMQELQDRSWRSLFVLEMRNVPYTEQEYVWVYVLRRLRRWRAALDAAGNGGYLAERLVQTFGASRVEAVLTNATWWLEQGPPVKARFEDGRVEIPRDSDVAADLRAVKVENGVATVPKSRTTGKGEDVKGGEAKRHADAAVALVMSGYAIRLGVVGEIGFQSSGSALPGVSREPVDRAFGVVASELQIESF
ncbi:terminase large subunit domain-containing protein [Phenylobacterium ferrooxidans]|uniref:Mu-like prophage FluMu protein gp28 n=1 Tax=Phenylobacterium ferrooxidans TaxID=2982689 RepID=A0ABW6CM82_9CAUL